MTLDRFQVARDLGLRRRRAARLPMKLKLIGAAYVAVVFAVIVVATLWVPAVVMWGIFIPLWGWFCWQERDVPLRRSFPTAVWFCLSVAMFVNNLNP